MGKQLKVAIIGCGRMGAFTTQRTQKSLPRVWKPLSHVGAVQEIEDLLLVSVCDKSRGAAKKVADAYPSVQVFTNHIEMLRETRPHLVGIATRTSGRCEIIRDCVRGGVLGIHSEKPMARSIDELMIGLDAINGKGVGLTFGAVRRYMAPYQLAREVALSGEIGDVQQVVIEHGADLLLWGHPHTVDLALFFNPGSFVQGVRAKLSIDPSVVQGPFVDCDPALNFCYLDFSNGTSTVITSGNGFNIRVHGTRGSVAVIGDGSRVELQKKASGRPYELKSVALPFSKKISGTKQAFLNLADFVRCGADLGISSADIESVHRVLFAMVISELRHGREVSPLEVPSNFFVSGRFGDLYS